MNKSIILFVSFCVVSIANLLAQNPYNDFITYVNKSEYFIKYQESIQAYQSPNRMHNLRSTFDGPKITIVPRVDSLLENPWFLNYEVLGVVGDNSLESKLTKINPKVEVENDKIDIHYDGFSIQSINSNKGLRQNFIVEKKNSLALLKIRIALHTNLIPYAADNKIFFYNENDINRVKPILVYEDIHSWDVNSNTLPSEIKLVKVSGKWCIDLIVDDENAVYPVVVDPITTTPGFVIQGDLATTFNIKQTASGDFNGDGLMDILAGANTYGNGESAEGIIKLFLGLPDGTFDMDAAWSYESNIISLNFGSKIANAGDINNDGIDDILIGCSSYDNGQTNEGRAYLFFGSASLPATTPDWTAESNVSSAEFGYSVSAAGDVNGDGYGDVVIGAYKQSTTGRVYVYYGNATGLSATGTILSGIGIGNEYGYSVAGGYDFNSDGFDDIVVSATFRQLPDKPTAGGTIFVYNGSISGINTTHSFAYTAKQANAHLGRDIEIADLNNDGFADIISCAADYDSLLTDNGLLHVFLGSATGFPNSPNQVFYGSQAASTLGTTIVNLGDINNDGFIEIAVGAPNHDVELTSTGYLYIFSGSSVGLITNPLLTYSYDEASASIGTSVAALGDINDDGFSDFALVNLVYNEPDVGAIIVFYGSEDPELNFSIWGLNSGLTAAYGSEIAVYDLNQDGSEDIIIGAPYFDGGSVDEGKIFVYYQNEGKFNILPDYTTEGQQASANFGWKIAGVGDVNGDGFVDLAVSATKYDYEFTDEGAVFIYFGNEDFYPNEWFRQIITGGTVDYSSAGFGENIAGLGDVNNDGFADILIAAHLYDIPATYSGIVNIYPGTIEGAGLSPIWQYTSMSQAETGAAILANTDVNNDGFDDLIISSPNADITPNNSEGKVELFYGNLTGFNLTPDWTYAGSAVSQNVGSFLSGNGDINGDGYDDFIIREYDYSAVSDDTINVKLFYGTSTVPEFSGWSQGDKQLLNQFAVEIEMKGDINGDGYDDILFSDPYGPSAGPKIGYVKQFNGGLYGPQLTAFTKIDNGLIDAKFGTAISIIPDLNEDAADDFLISAPYETINGAQGVVRLYYGSVTGCPASTPVVSSITETAVEFSIDLAAPIVYIKWKATASEIWNFDSTTSDIYTISGLSPCSNYEIIVQSGCIDGFSIWTTPLNFTTDCAPCTDAPTGLFADNITASSAKIHWTADPDATKYKISYRKVGGSWINVNATANFKNLPGLLPESTYQYKVKSVCGALQGPFSPVSTFTTLPLKEGVATIPEFDIFPNPASNNFTIQTNFSINAILILDIYGNVINSLESVNQNLMNINIAGLPQGVYYVNIISSDNQQNLTKMLMVIN